MRIRAFVAWYAPAGASPPLPAAVESGSAWSVWHAGGLRVEFQRREQSGATSGAPAGHAPALVLGDASEWDARDPSANLASGVPLELDRDGQQLRLSTSIVALPPVFHYAAGGVVALASDLRLLRRVPGVRLELDPAGVAELGHFGHPVEHRTLFRNVAVLPAAARVSLDRAGVRVVRAWSLPERPPLDWPAFVEAQIAAFSAQVERLDVTRSFLSLTAGLDTRTVFASLAAGHRLVPAATMTGRRRSLDARIAARLCDAYGISHHPVTFDDRFAENLPRFVEQASLLSGGLASVDQAPEIFMYEQLGPGFDARVSGNLGNQVGRGGTEGVSIRGANLGVLSPALGAAGTPAGHWLLKQLDRDERSVLHFILHSEIPFTLLPNFSVGNHFAVQQSPYASRLLIETLASRPRRASGPSASRTRMRLRDLKHRFLGEPAAHSFQRTLVTRLNGFAARCPVNWGWRPVGSVSLPGLAMGVATLVGMAARAKGLDAGLLRAPMQWTGLPSLHDFRDARQWLRHDLREYVNDTLRSPASDLFDARSLVHVLDDHYRRGHDHYHTLTFALDVALAHRNFCQ